MDQFTVPQFIDIEDKIFGPITTRQFIIMLVASLIIFVAFKLADITLFIFILVVVGGFALVLAFIKINGQSFHYFLLNIFQTLRRPSRRVWNRFYTNPELQELRKNPPVAEAAETVVKRYSQSRIRDLSLLVNTGGYYKPEV